jgi:excisionase family DNA binding protein
MTGYVYIYGGNGVYKIGKANDVQKRLRSITQPPFRCSLIHVLPSDDPSKLERAIHVYFRHKRVNGEWFNLSDDDIIYLKMGMPTHFKPAPVITPIAPPAPSKEQKRHSESSRKGGPPLSAEELHDFNEGKEMGADDVGRYLRFSPGAIERMAARGELPAIKVGKEWRFKKEYLDARFDEDAKKKLCAQ